MPCKGGKKKKGKRYDSKRQRGTENFPDNNIPAESDEKSYMELLEEPRIIRTREFATKPMSVDEAAMQLRLNNDNFLVFMNSYSNNVNVLYRRNDGNFGLIEPEF